MPIQRNDGFLFNRTFSLSVEDADALASNGVEDLLYINLHSNDFPSGEIRGQLDVVQDNRPVDGGTDLEGTLSGDQEVPGVETDAEGQATVFIGSSFVASGTTSLSVSMAVLGLDTDAARAMHIHNAPAGSNGGVAFNLDPDGALQADTPEALEAAGFEALTEWTGTQDADEITGSGAVDVVTARNGNDDIDGKGNDDVISGGKGKDKIKGGNDDDLLDGGKGKDKIKGGKGADTVLGGEGNDVITTGKGKDVVVYDMADPEANGTDRIKDFGSADSFAFLGSGAKTKFSRADADDPAATIKAQSNVVVLTDTALTLEEALDFLEGASDADRDGLFAYFDSEAEEARLVFSEHLGDADAPTTTLARFGDDRSVLGELGSRSFDFVDADSVDFG